MTAQENAVPDIGDFAGVPIIEVHLRRGTPWPRRTSLVTLESDRATMDVLDLITGAALATEMGADAADIGPTVYPHPTMSETIGMAAEAFEGTITDLYLPKKK